MLIHVTTLGDYLAKHNATPAVKSVIATLTHTCEEISELLKRGALADILGEAGNQNVQGEEQKKLDVIANELLLNALANNKYCAGVASEELDHATAANCGGEVLVLFDPLDGSSNIDINMAVGTIFSVLPYNNQGQTATDDDFLQKGTEQLAAGYVLYGTSTILALTTGDGVVMFSYDPNLRQFILIKDRVNVPVDTKEYAINASNYRYWLPPMQRYIDECNAGEAGVRGKDFNMRWIAAMVGDVHRILTRGGLFSYPFDTKFANKAGKLRLMYEANPMSFIIEQAGGASSDALNRILDIKPTSIHQRVPVVLGAKNEVEYIKKLHVEMG
ncbi:fructose-1,6-bisphosphatase [Moraxella macacae 0408225]|uniref:Fructose-1,6-bisphosphatase class 1 n=1 Tax=Moraxella macacae 0408225 TaxID=1230338 RepID=L2F6J0_9GAMM|nr:class 1 fructose-bisphosphatase [Moraxella macacae]ELA08647.1 fructose-1,6-bisphosphatase [Moraxella macacae 0408225]